MSADFFDYDRHIAFVADEVDYDRIRDVMKFLKWKWVSSETDDGFPSTKELRHHAMHLAKEALAGLSKERDDNPFNSGVVSYCVSSGGFKARWQDFRDNKPYKLEIYFVLDSADSEYDATWANFDE